MCPYVSWNIYPERPNGNSYPKQHQNSDEILRRLGFTLVELCFGKPFSELEGPGDLGGDEVTAKTQSARKLLNQVYDEGGCRYGKLLFE